MVNSERYCTAENIGLSTQDLEKIRAVFASFETIEQVFLYGSRAKGNFKTYADIDITLLGNQLCLTTQFRIDDALDELYLPYTFDISILSQISNLDLLAHIERVGLVLYSKSNIEKQ